MALIVEIETGGKVTIGDNIVVTFKQYRADCLRAVLAIDAPRELPIKYPPLRGLNK